MDLSGPNLTITSQLVANEHINTIAIAVRSGDIATLALMLQRHGTSYVLHRAMYRLIKARLHELLRGKPQESGPTQSLKTMSVRELSQQTGIPEHTIREAYRTGALRVARCGKRGGIRVSQDDAEKWLASRKARP